jgi:hypothetical protein
MTTHYDEVFQERVDELLLLEQRADRRAEKFLTLSKEYQESNQTVLLGLIDKAEQVKECLSKINTASEQVSASVASSEKHAHRTVKLFLSTLVICLLMIASTLWWSRHIQDALEQDKIDLAALDVKLHHTPVIVPFKGKEYVRIVPDSEMTFTHKDGKAVPGLYAEVWHV